MQIDFSPYKIKTEIGKRHLESFELIKWVMKAKDQTKGKGARPWLQHIKIENPLKDGYNGMVAEMIACDGFRIHHALIGLPVTPDNFSQGIYNVSTKGKTLIIDPATIEYKYPDWKAIVDYGLFDLEKVMSKFTKIDGAFLVDSIPPKTEDDTDSVTIKYRDEKSPMLIYRSNNRTNYAVIMPMWL